MRAHLSKSFDLGKMMLFPGWGLRSIKIGSEEIVKELKVKVYCSCRKQQDRRKMAQCIKCNDHPYSHAPPLLVAYLSDDKGSGLNLKSSSEVTEVTSKQPLNYYSVALIYKIMACKPTP